MNRRMRSMTLQDHLYELVHHGVFTVTQLADEFGCSESLLYRGSSPNDKTNFPANKLAPCMKKQGNFNALHHIASQCDHLCIPMPKKRGRMRPEEVAELQAQQAAAIKALTDFFAGKMSQDDARKEVEQAMGSLARGRMAVNHGIKQEELDL